MKKLDKILLIAIVGVLGILLGGYYLRSYILSNQGGDRIVQILVNGDTYKEVSLRNVTEEFDIKTKFGKNSIKIYNDGIEIVDADCPDHICVKTGFKNKPGEMIVCLPNRVFIKIKGQAEEGIDEIAQ